MKTEIKGVILAGGTGSRLHPLTKVTNKHLLPVGHQPMIYYPVQKMKQAGIDQILVVTGVEHMGDVVSLLGSGKEFGCEFTYRVQEEAGGIAQALLLAEHFLGHDSVFVMLGDNIFQDNVRTIIDKYTHQPLQGAHLFLKKVHDPNRYGVAELHGDRIVSIVEKPVKPLSNMAITGNYLYDSTVFDRIRQCKPSKRGELEISDVNTMYLNDSMVTYSTLDGWWTDAGTFSSLATASQLAITTPIC